MHLCLCLPLFVALGPFCAIFNFAHLELLKKLLADGGYTGENFANEIKRISGAEVEVVKRNELHTFAVLPKRWIVERSFAWLDKYRRLWKNCERKLQNSF